MSVKVPASRHQDICRHDGWRGFGGGAVTLNSVEFDRQLDKISQWIEEWDHNTRCHIFEALLRQSNFTQIQFLWTVIQPALHRDFMYTASKDYPTQPFIPISTHHSRDLKARLIRYEQDKYHRVNSAYFQKYDQVKEVAKDASVRSQRSNGSDLKLPNLSQLPATPKSAYTPHHQEANCMSRSEGTYLLSSVETAFCPYSYPATLPSSPSKSTRPAQSVMKSVTLPSTPHGQTRPPTRLTGNVSPEKSPFGASSPGKSMTLPCSSPSKTVTIPCSSPTKSFMASPSRKTSPNFKSTVVLKPHRIPAVLNPHGSPRFVRVTLKTPRTESVPANTVEKSMDIKPEKLNSAPPCMRFIEMPIRRHMQEGEVVNVSPPDLMSTWKPVSRFDDNMPTTSTPKTGDNPRKAKRKRRSKSVIPSEGKDVILWFTEYWSDLQRNEFLHKILLKLDPRQHYFISSFLSVKRHIDILALLPEHIALTILSFLTPRQLLRTSRVSRTWYRLCNDNDIWRKKCQEVKLIMPVNRDTANWKEVFRENDNLTANWDAGNAKVLECYGHSDRVLSLTLHENRMATGSLDKTIRIWEIQDGRCLQVLKGHTKGIWCLRFFTSKLLISASYDHTIRVWNLRDGNCIRTLLGHEGAVWAIVLRENVMVSASQDKTAKLWDMNRCALLTTLKGHHSAVFCADMSEDGKLVITGSADKTVRIWKAKSGRQLKVIWVPQGTSVMSVSYSHGWMACSHGNIICLYRLDKFQIVRQYTEHTKRIESLKLRISNDPNNPEGHIVSAGQDGVLKYWDITKSKSTQTFSGHHAWINCIHFDATHIATASYDNKIKIMDFTILPEPDDDDDDYDD